MMGLVRYPVSSVLDCFRERMTRGELATRGAARVLACGEGMVSLAQELFPGADVQESSQFSSIGALRRARFDAACIAMAGGDTRQRLRALFSGARDVLLVPSPDYLYRLGMRAGTPALLWAVVDRFLLAPLALLWLGVLSLLMGLAGLMRAAGATQEQATRGPLRVLVIRLMPTPLLLRLLRRLREEWPPLHITVVIASQEGAEALAELADEVLCTAGLGGRGAMRALREVGAEVTILAGGAGYGLRPTYLKAVLLTRSSGARERGQWEPGDALPGRTIPRQIGATFRRSWARRWRRYLRPAVRWATRVWQRRYYQRPPTRGPRLVQIGLSEACNYRCLMCAFHNPTVDATHVESQMPKMSLETFTRLITDLKRLGTESMDICGNGEPLTNPHAMEMITRAREMGFEVTLATNAGLLTEARARTLVDLGLRRMHVSINAGSDETYAQMHPGTPPGAMSAIITRLRAMAEYAEQTGQRPIDVEYSAVLTRLNMHEMVAMVEAAREARAKWLMLIRMGPVDGGEDLMPRPEDWEAIRADVARAKQLAKQYDISNNLDEFDAVASSAGARSIYEQIPCYIGSEFALIFASGMVNFCCHCYKLIGNVNEKGFSGVWHSPRYQELRAQAMSLPQTRRSLHDCGCFFSCSHIALNVEVHERLYGKNSLLRGGE